VPVPDNQLPVELPKVEHYEPTDTGESPLAAVTDWVNTTCPICGGKAKRETDTMPNWAGSSWYYLRYYDAHNDKVFADRKKLDYWGEVDFYLGGMEHTTLHLLYSRFWHQFLYDKGLVPTPEPYKSRRGQGIILAPDNSKMSKSKGNVVNPSDIIDQGYGADALRLAITFLAPYEQTTPWNPETVSGTFRFLQRVWAITQRYTTAKKTKDNPEQEGPILVATHAAIKKVSGDIKDMGFNTAIAALMEFTNELYKIEAKAGFKSAKAWQFALENLMQLLSPFAPHISEELWQQLGAKESVHLSSWPVHDEAYLVKDVIKIAVQVNGKLRGEIEVANGSSQEVIEQEAKLNQNVAKLLTGDIKKVIYINGRLINFVI
jgi:leucyl-tRNA synthetase